MEKTTTNWIRLACLETEDKTSENVASWFVVFL